MTIARLLRERARAQAGLLGLVGLLAALVAGTLVAVLGYVDSAARDGLASALRSAEATDAAMQLATPRSTADPQAQAEAGEQVLAEVLDDLPVAVHRSARSTALDVGGLDVSGLDVVAAADPELAGRVEVTAGRLPTDGTGASVSDRTAQLLGLAVGDRLALTGASARAEPLTVTVTAVWTALDPGDPVWFGEDAPAVWLTEDALDRVPATVRVRWTVVPDPDRLLPEQVPTLRAALDRALDALKADDAVDELGVLATGGLDRTLASVDRTLSTVRALSWPATLLAALVGAVVLGRLAALLAEVRRGEHVVLRSRGASRRQLVSAAGLEGLVVGLPAAAVGAGLASFGGSPGTVLAVGAPAASAAAVALTLAGATWLTVRGPLHTPRADLRVAHLFGAVAVVAALAGIAVARLVVLGTPVTERAGRAVPEPLATAAVPLGLLAVALLTTVCLGPAGRLWLRRTARGSGTGFWAAAHLARRPTASVATAALTSLAVAAGVLVAAVLGSWSATQQLRARVETGAATRVIGADAAQARAAAARLGLVAEPVAVREVTLGALTADLRAVPAVAWPWLALAPGERLPAPADVALGPVVPAGELALAVAVTGDDARVVAVTGWLDLEPGHLVAVPAEAGAAGSWTLPVAEGSRALAAVDVQVTATGPYSLDLTAAGAPLAADWHAVQPGAADLDPGLPVEVPTSGTVRLLTTAPAPLPVVVTRTLAGALDLAVGETTSAVVPGHAIDLRVVGLVAAVPGSADPFALLADLDAWARAQLATGPDVAAAREYWSPQGSARPTDGIRTWAPQATPLLDPALVAFRLATWATVALAAAGVLAASRAAARSRRPELAVLRGLGVPPRTQAGLRVDEQVRVLAAAALGGGVGGAGLALLVVRPLVAALDDGALPLPVLIGVDVPALVGWLAVGLAAVAAVVGAMARDTAGRAVAASPREVGG